MGFAVRFTINWVQVPGARPGPVFLRHSLKLSPIYDVCSGKALVRKCENTVAFLELEVSVSIGSTHFKTVLSYCRGKGFS